MIRVAKHLRLDPESLHLACNCFDRFVAAPQTSSLLGKARLMLLATAALNCAVKYEESQEERSIMAELIHKSQQPCKCNDRHTHMHSAQGARLFTAARSLLLLRAVLEKHVINMEGTLLNAISFNVCTVSPVAFLRRFLYVSTSGAAAASSSSSSRRGSSASSNLQSSASSIASSGYALQSRALHLLEMALVPTEMARFAPSVQAAAALLAARKTHASQQKAWPPELVALTSYTTADLKVCEAELVKLTASHGKQAPAAHNENWQERAKALLSPETVMPPKVRRKGMALL